MPLVSNNNSPGRSRLRLLLLGGGALLVAIVIWRWVDGRPVEAAAASNPPAPVEVATAARRDVPVYLTAIGTVQAFNTVTATARVDGQIVKVAFTEGQDVKKGDLLAQIDPRPYQSALEQAEAKETQDEAMLANTQRDLQRYTALAAMDYTSQQTLDTTRSQAAQLSAQIKSDKAAVMNAQTQLTYTSISSPIDGRTGIRLIDIGNNVHAADTTGIVTITQIHPISVIFSLPEDDLPDVSSAMQAGQLSVTALTRDGSRVLDQGTVALVDNQIDQTTGTIRLKATFPNQNNTLWPGAYINARLLLKSEKNILTVPSTAVQHGPTGLFAYVLQPDSTVQMRPIKVALDTGSLAVVDSGIAAGERVVTEGQYGLKPMAKVEVQKSAPAAATATP